MTNEQRKANLKARIDAAAAAVFQRKGYAETRIRDIAEEADVSPSTIYLYYDGKKQLFRSLNIPEAEQKRPEFDRRREEIIRVALSLFGENGYEGTTMDDIANRIGFSKAALYQYCSSKKELFYQVLALCTHATPPDPTSLGVYGDDWHAVIHNIARTYMDICRDPDSVAFLGAVIRDSHKFPEFGQAYYDRSVCTARNCVGEYLRSLQEKGEIRTDIDPLIAAASFLGSLTAHIILTGSMTGGIPQDMDEQLYIDTTAENLIRALEI